MFSKAEQGAADALVAAEETWYKLQSNKSKHAELLDDVAVISEVLPWLCVPDNFRDGRIEH